MHRGLKISLPWAKSMMTVRRVFLPLVCGLCLASLPTTASGQQASDILRDGFQALKAGEFVRARELFAEVNKRQPSAENLSYLAMAEAGCGDRVQAISDFERSIRLGNNSALVHYDLGIAYLDSGQHERGFQELRAALAKDPNYEQPAYALGVALLQMGRARDALPYFRQCTKQSPQNPEVWLGLTRAEFESGDNLVALATTDEAMAKVPDNPRLAMTLASLCLQHDQTKKARGLLERRRPSYCRTRQKSSCCWQTYV